MVLILGARGAGKTDYVRSLGFADADFGTEIGDGRPVLAALEDLVRRDPERADALFPALCEKECVICQEVGSGVIPLNREDRRYRDAVGRLCVRLAREATAVVRVVAGIPVVLKGVIPCARS